MTAKQPKPLQTEDILLLHKLSDQLVTTQGQIEQLRTRRDDNKEVLSMFKENKISDDTRLFMNVGKHFVKHKKAEAFVFLESEQRKLMSDLKEKEKQVEDVKKKIRKINPKLDLVDYDAYCIIAPDLEDENEDSD